MVAPLAERSSANITTRPGTTLGEFGSTSRRPTEVWSAPGLAAVGHPAQMGHDLRRGGQRVLALRHRRGAGMGGGAGDLDLQLVRAPPGVEHAEPAAAALEFRRAFDVQLEIGGGRRWGRVRPAKADRVQRLGDADALAVAASQGPVEGARTGIDRGADQARLEARTFLAGPGDHDETLAHVAARGHRVGGHQRRQHAIGAVEPPAARLAVEVRAGHDGARRSGRSGRTCCRSHRPRHESRAPSAARPASGGPRRWPGCPRRGRRRRRRWRRSPTARRATCRSCGRLIPRSPPCPPPTAAALTLLWELTGNAVKAVDEVFDLGLASRMTRGMAAGR